MTDWQLTQDRDAVKVYTRQHTDSLDRRLSTATFSGSVRTYGKRGYGDFHEGRKASLSIIYHFPQSEPWKYELHCTFPLFDDRSPSPLIEIIPPSGIQRVWRGPREFTSGILLPNECADLITVGTLLLAELPSPLDPRFFGDPMQYHLKLP